jgi:hypothetical protein
MTAAGVVLLSEEELAHLTEAELEEYHEYLKAELTTERWELQPKQQRAEDLTRECDEVGYGGAAGGGKSDWGLWHIYELSKRVPKHRSLVLRTVLPELKRTLIARSLEKFDPAEAHYRPGDKEWRFENGSVIEFGYLDKDDDVYQYKSAEYDCIFFDEATELSAFQYDYLKSRCRTTRWKRSLGAWPHIINATNPGGKGHGWYKERFVVGTGHGERVNTVEFEDPITKRIAGTRSLGFVPATLHDNAFIDPGYKLNLLALGGVEMRQLYLGDWDVFAGQFFDQWTHGLHVIRPFTIPKQWRRFRGIDYGYAAPFACLWLAIDPEGLVYVYRENYETRLTARQQAMLVRGSESPAEKIDYTVADPSIWAKQGSGESVAQQYRAAGLLTRKAKNARVDGWSQVREHLRPQVPMPDPAGGEELIIPRLRVFPGCENLIRTLPLMLHDKDRPEDLDTDLEDHAVDALRYALMSRPRIAKPKEDRRRNRTLEEQMAEDLDDLVASRAANNARHPVMGKL